MKTFIYVGCRQNSKEQVEQGLQSDDWREIRFDINLAVKPVNQHPKFTRYQHQAKQPHIYGTVAGIEIAHEITAPRRTAQSYRYAKQ